MKPLLQNSFSDWHLAQKCCQCHAIRNGNSIKIQKCAIFWRKWASCHSWKKKNKQTYKKQYNYLLQSLEVCLISEVTMKTADSFSQSSTKSLQYPNSATGGQEPAANQRITITLSIRLVKSFYLTIILQRSKWISTEPKSDLKNGTLFSRHGTKHGIVTTNARSVLIVVRLGVAYCVEFRL